MKVTAALAPEPPIKFEPVSGKGREPLWGIFQKIFKESFSKDYRESLVKRANEKKDLKFRLIKKGEESIGIIIYVQEPATNYSIFGWNYAFHVKALHVIPNFNRAVRAELILTAQGMEASSILVNVLKTNNQLKEDLKARSFKRIESAHSDIVDLFGYDGKKEIEKQQVDIKPRAIEKGDDLPPIDDLRPTIEIEDDRPEKKPKIDSDQ